MRVNGYQCDVCCTVKSGETSLSNWFALYDFRKGVESDEQHFCSLHCLHEWVEKQLPVVEETSMIEYANRSGHGPLVSANEVNLMPAPTTVVHSEYWRDL